MKYLFIAVQAVILNILCSTAASAEANHFGLDMRKRLGQKGVSIEAAYTVDYFANTRGGLKREDTYLTNLDVMLTLDTGKLGLWENGRLFVYVLENSGGEKLTGTIVGDLQTISNIEAPRTVRLYELWYEHFFNDESVSILFGLHDYNSEFNVTEYGGLFINSSFGIQPDISASARPSVFPLAAPGVRLKVSPNKHWEYLVGVYDGDPGDPEIDEHFPKSEFDSDGGGLFTGEIIYHFDNEDFPGALKIGIWNNTGVFDDVTDLDLNGDPARHKGNAGAYIVMDKQLTKEKDSDQGLGAFIQFGVSDNEVNEVDMYIGAGLNYKGLIPGRDSDETGLAVGRAVVNDDVVKSGGRDDHETVIELTHSFQINEILRIQPDLQYVINPGAVSGVNNALVAGIRMELAF